MDPRERAERYAARATEGIVADLTATPHGGRNAAAFRAAVRLVTLHAHGLVSEGDARAAHESACAAIGLPREEIKATWKSGWREGTRNPSDLPPDIAEIVRTGTVTPHRHTPTAPAKSRPEPEPNYPPAAEVAALWEAGLPVPSDAQAREWLEKTRKEAHGETFRADAITPHLARILPGDATVPAWAHWKSGTPLTRTGHRLMVPLFDSRGVMRSLRFRFVGEGAKVKATPPMGYEVRGLVMANVSARCWLELGSLPANEPEREFRAVSVYEGEPDFLRHASATSWPVLGIVSGAFSPRIASRTPDGTRVVVFQHPDAAGKGYTEKIRKAFAGRAGSIRLQFEPMTKGTKAA